MATPVASVLFTPELWYWPIQIGICAGINIISLCSVVLAGPAMTWLHIMRREGGVEWVVSAALAAGGVRVGDVGLHVGRHYSIRDLITWCNRMQVRKVLQ